MFLFIMLKLEDIKEGKRWFLYISTIKYGQDNIRTSTKKYLMKIKYPLAIILIEGIDELNEVVGTYLNKVVYSIVIKIESKDFLSLLFPLLIIIVHKKMQIV